MEEADGTGIADRLLASGAIDQSEVDKIRELPYRKEKMGSLVKAIVRANSKFLVGMISKVKEAFEKEGYDYLVEDIDKPLGKHITSQSITPFMKALQIRVKLFLVT